MTQLNDEVLLGIRTQLVAMGGQAAARALTAMDDGGFGTCLTCGEDLDVDALIATPTLAFCEPCAGDRLASKRRDTLRASGPRRS